MRRWVALAALVALPARASDVQTPGAPWLTNVEMPRAAAMGGAHAAVATGNDALLTNPAGISQLRRYHLQLDGMLDTRFPARAFNISILDTTTAAFGTGFLYSNWSSGRENGRANGWMGVFAYSYQVGSVFVGGATRYMHFDVPDSESAPEGKVHTWLQDLGLLVRRGNFSWAAVVQNIGTKALPLFPLTATAGMSVGSDASSHLAFDYKADLHDSNDVKHRLAAGYETLFDGTFPVRLGGTYDASSKDWWISAGVGILTQSFGFQLVWRRKLTGELDQFFQAGITLYLEQ